VPIVDGERGRAFDLRDSEYEVAAVAAAIRSNSDDDSDASDDSPLTVRCPEPGEIHDHVGIVEPDRSYPLQTALAEVAPVRGHESSVDEALADVREELAALDLPSVSLEAKRRQVAETDDAAGLEEQVATLRGELEAAKDRGEDPAALADARERAVADLTERRTERLAAEQSLERARTDAREARDRREERLRLQDRERNLERDARRELAGELQSSFERALSALGACGSGAVDGASDGYGANDSDVVSDRYGASDANAPASVDGPDAIGALAVCRIAPISAPVVVAGEWFASATAAAAALDAPVILVEA